MLDTYKNKGSSFSVVQFLIFHPEVVDGVSSNTKVNSENVEEISEEEWGRSAKNSNPGISVII